MDGSGFGLLLRDPVHDDPPSEEPGFAAGLPLMLVLVLATLGAIIVLGPAVPVIAGL